MKGTPKIIFIMGMARSGTTILEILLANNDHVVGAGEITHSVSPVSYRHAECSCGNLQSECDIWKQVEEDISGCELETGFKLLRSTESHQRFFLNFFKMVKGEDIAKYQMFNFRVFRALGKSGFTTVIDSSKYATRALLLHRFFGDTVHVVCITRSAKGIISAFKKRDLEQPPKSLLAVFFYYLYTLTCFWFCRLELQGAMTFLTYEKLKRDPVSALLEVQDGAGINLVRSRNTLNAGGDFDTGHIVVGNRLRNEKKVKFQARAEPDITSVFESILAFFMQAYRRLLRF